LNSLTIVLAQRRRWHFSSFFVISVAQPANSSQGQEIFLEQDAVANPNVQFEDQSTTLKPLRVYFEINGQPLSKPSKASVIRFEPSKSSSIDYQLAAGVPGPDYADVSISHLASISTLDQSYLGKSIIWLNNTEKISVTLLETEKEAQDQLRIYGVDRIHSSPKLMKVEVTASKIDFDIPSTSIKSFKPKNKTQLEGIKNSSSSNGKF
jgi:hypothetical protein